MSLPENVTSLIDGLPDPEAASRFYSDLVKLHPHQADRAGEALLSDLVTLSAYSPLLATTVLQNPEYIQWLGRERTDTKIRSKESLFESLSRFSLLHTQISSNVMLARFRRRELLRIFLRDIRRLATIAEITEELSNLADAIIEFALRLAQQDLQNRFGSPMRTDERGRLIEAAFCVVALGKLGSKELNYSSDIDLLFLYSHEGTTSGAGAAGQITNREYFIKLAEKVLQLAGGPSGEGAAYRIDMRLRPHGSIGRLALSLDETIRYYKTEARAWERQVLIRARAIAGEASLYKDFYASVEEFVFQAAADVTACLVGVRSSKRQIEDPTPSGPGYNVKLGRGGIREIEFLAQALQLAYGGRDQWLRYPHTLVSLSRLSDRGLIKEDQLTDLFDSYDFLRRVEHLLQMEHGLQIHSVPKAPDARQLLARRAGFVTVGAFDAELKSHTQNVQHVFDDVFGASTSTSSSPEPVAAPVRARSSDNVKNEMQRSIAAVSPHFAQIAASPAIDLDNSNFQFADNLRSAVASTREFGKRLSLLRRVWTNSMLGIVVAEIDGRLTTRLSKQRQTELAEASIETALAISRDEMATRYGKDDINLSILALGKLGGKRVDYGSDLDMVLVYPDNAAMATEFSSAETYGHAVEIFVNTISGVTRDGNLYRVDLRLRPYGKNGASSNPISVFVDYFRETADIWELLAFVKLRGVAGELAEKTERTVREIIHNRALEIDPDKLRSETVRVRDLLERQKGGRRSENDIKYGPGGMLDVYFATRYLQLRDNIPDRADDRSTAFMLETLWENGSLSAGDHEALSIGYEFLSELDHNIRLVTGRSRKLPTSPTLLEIIGKRMNVDTPKTMIELLAMHRMSIRRSFESVLSE
jgi:glutamate-ammonia-ligase adenylyltransferase